VAAVQACPFLPGGDEKRVHLLFPEGAVTADGVDQLRRDHAGRGPERLAEGPDCLYIDFAGGVAGTKLTNDFMARRLGCRGTARNVNSIRRIIEKMDS